MNCVIDDDDDDDDGALWGWGAGEENLDETVTEQQNLVWTFESFFLKNLNHLRSLWSDYGSNWPVTTNTQTYQVSWPLTP